MNFTNINRTVRRFSSLLLLLSVFLLSVSALLMDLDEEEIFDVGDIHEFLGFTMLGLLLVHLVMVRKSIMRLIFNSK